MKDAAQMVKRCEALRLDSERLTIRRFDPEDFETALAHESDRRIMRYIRDPMPEDSLREKTRSFMGSWKAEENEWLGLPVTLLQEQHKQPMIGMACFRVMSFDNETVEIGYRFHQDHHGQGYGIEMARRLCDFLFDDLEVRKLVAFVVAENEASCRLLERLGMRREAHFREFSKLGGGWCDELVYGQLAKER